MAGSSATCIPVARVAEACRLSVPGGQQVDKLPKTGRRAQAVILVPEGRHYSTSRRASVCATATGWGSTPSRADRSPPPLST